MTSVKSKILFMLVAAALLPASLAFPQQFKPVTVGNTGKTLSMVPFEMGIKKGYFKQDGLDVKLITIRQSDVIIKATLAQELSFTTIIPTAILASVRGLPIRTVGINFDQAPYALNGRPQIKSMSGLRGAKIAISSLGSMSTYVIREIVSRSRLDPDRDVTFLAVGGSEARSAALIAGFVDAALVIAPFNYKLERQGYTRLAWAPDYARFPLGGVAAANDFLLSNRELVLATLRGLAGGSAYVKQHRAEMLEFIRQYLELPEEEAINSYEFLVASTPDNLITDDSVIRKAMEFAAQALRLKPEATPDIANVRDWSFARALK